MTPPWKLVGQRLDTAVHPHAQFNQLVVLPGRVGTKRPGRTNRSPDYLEMVLVGPDFPGSSAATTQALPALSGHFDGWPLKSVGGSSLGHSFEGTFAVGGQMIPCLSGVHSHACAGRPDAINKMAATDIANASFIIVPHLLLLRLIPGSGPPT